ncbi:Hypothetical predicted protein [Olea europaea subsp. europaea]|uniref:Uncharacterized protein n=1 Tax=Olea europaea subsp. europaea TaxID=158383 RepID=A0A8S0TQ21_OLEEU|nr:Hypothetical predicted protein [Olea europaea subsp. europaea]
MALSIAPTIPATTVNSSQTVATHVAPINSTPPIISTIVPQIITSPPLDLSTDAPTRVDKQTLSVVTLALSPVA